VVTANSFWGDAPVLGARRIYVKHKVWFFSKIFQNIDFAQPQKQLRRTKNKAEFVSDKLIFLLT
jgi:hypothetical protein